MSAREAHDVLDVEARIIESDAFESTAAAPTSAPAPQAQELNLLPALTAKAEIAKANPAVANMKALLARIQAELPTLNVGTKEGEKRARELRAECVKLRTSTENAYKAWNAPLLEAQRGIREIVKSVSDGIEPVEAELDAMVKNIEAAREAEKQRKLEIEQARIAALREKITTTFVNAPVAAVKMTSAEIDEKVRELQDLAINDAEDSFGEFSDEAEALRGRVIGELLELSRAKRTQEDEAARLERQRQEQLEAERRATADRALRAKIDAIKAKTFDCFGKTAAQIKRIRDELVKLEPSEVEFAEMHAEARATWLQTSDMVAQAWMSQVSTETRQAALERETAQLRQQQEAQAAAERRQREAKEADERAKAERDARVEVRMQNLRAATRVSNGMASVQINSTIETVLALAVDTDNFGDRLDEALALKAEVVRDLEYAFEAAAQAEAAEFERQRRSRELAAEDNRKAAEAQARINAEREAAEARELDVLADSFYMLASNVVDALVTVIYPEECPTEVRILTILTHPKVQAAMAKRLQELSA